MKREVEVERTTREREQRESKKWRRIRYMYVPHTCLDCAMPSIHACMYTIRTGAALTRKTTNTVLVP